MSVPEGANLANHLALLALSRGAEGQTRLITTNFDTLFERAWLEKYQKAIASHASAAMPAPKASGFEGVLHLHGRLADDSPKLSLAETDLVLTSSEFGDAYLRSGWASRYVYDVVRACTVVLVGYSADDPPMRYLLEVLEADRERYSDLHRVYAFAASKDEEEELEAALWRAKGIEPILYRPSENDHSALYKTLEEWRDYANDPTAWRREALRVIFTQSPKEQGEDELARCAALLRHRDAAQLLAELSPPSDWLSPLNDRRVFAEQERHAGQWIAARLNDADMIRASISLPYFSDECAWYIELAIEQKRAELSPVRLKAWQLILRSKRQVRIPSRMLDDNWYTVSRYIRQGDAGYHIRQVVRKLLQPRLTVAKAFRLSERTTENEPERLFDLLRIDFDAPDHVPIREILLCWPESLDKELALFRVLERALTEALEEAHDLGLLDGWDCASGDVPSIGDHPQNKHRRGFYPIIRVLADLWGRIASRDPETARTLISSWWSSPYLLERRFYLSALCSDSVFSCEEVWSGLDRLSPEDFWLGGAQVEIMRLVTLRWREFAPAQRQAFEARICSGLPRDLFQEGSFEKDEWGSVYDSAVMKRLNRLKLMGWPLNNDSETLLREIASRHPRWAPGEGDRDDFSSWHESHSGPDGQPELLANIADSALVSEAMRLQRESRWQQGDVWRLFCAADPERAQLGLRSEAKAGRWEVDAWRDFIWSATERSEDTLQLELAASLLAMPEAVLTQLLPAACRWLQKRRQLLTRLASREGNFLTLWDRLAELAYPANAPSVDKEERGAYDRALNDPAGELADALLRHIDARKPEQGGGFTEEEAIRLNRIVHSDGDPGLLARATLCRFLAYLEATDPDWVLSQMLPFLSWDQPHAASLWRSRAFDNIGTARLFNATKTLMLEAFVRPGLGDDELEGLMTQLLTIAFAHRRQELIDYALSSAEIKNALAAGSDRLRTNAAWQFWRAMGDEADKAARWNEMIGPVFRGMWPLDAALRNEGVSQNLVLMTLECGEAFPDAVDAVIVFLVPYQLYLMAHTLRLESAHDDLIRKFPRAALRLASAIIDPDKYPVPSDLSSFLELCIESDASVASEPSYIRLFGLRRQRAA
ncbi:SIR2 family protein [Methylocystis sp. MJC1]|uniref:SIR2 family protein n=1 Tax=Methylocystis sp. MJC1 TaxID=2654282 RepID=UPI0013ED2D77|nr:SIR2 family protein [Methylocystis sp. MJC1]MBU6527983.1 SIR2 family protein [Methylocystis sp. MJC1]UZX10903.1 SIR2 family protein [Methylocystis sp. MJC1]